MPDPSPSPIEWRGVRLDPRGPSVWLSADLLWKLTPNQGVDPWMACLQLDVSHLVVDTGRTPTEALERVASRAAVLAVKLTDVLEQISVPLAERLAVVRKLEGLLSVKQPPRAPAFYEGDLGVADLVTRDRDEP
jgi:hypothetical protein